MIWYELETAKYQSIVQEVKMKAIEIAKVQLKLTQYDLREIRPDDLPSPSLTDFTIVIAAATAFTTVLRKVSSNSLVIIAGFYCPDRLNNRDGIDEGVIGQPILKHMIGYRGTELIRKWPLCPVYAMKDGAAVTEGYMIFYPDDVIDLRFYAKETSTHDQISQSWYIWVCLLPPGATTATEAVT